MEAEISDLKETLERKMTSNKIEVIYWGYNSVDWPVAIFALRNQTFPTNKTTTEILHYAFKFR